MTTTLQNDLELTVDRAVVRHRGTVLADLSDLHLRPGHPVTIVGESGSGKSILAHAVMGTLPVELDAEGSVAVGTAQFDLADRTSRRHLWGRQLALLPQEPALALDPTMRVRAQVEEGAAGWRPRRAEFRRLADERLASLGLGHAADSFPHTLSGGMAQRVAYAAATIGGAPVLIVDEPSKGLDAHALDRLTELLTAHLAAGGLLLMITHDLQLARRIGGTVLVMRDASVVESGPAEEVLTQPAHPYTQQLLAAEPRHWNRPWMASERSGGDTLLTARGLTKSYDGAPLFQDLDLAVHAGERWAVTGASGTGKTTLGNVLLGLTSVDAGEVVRGVAATGSRLQKLYQDPSLSFPRRVALASSMRDVLRRHEAPAARMHTLLDRVGLSPSILERRPGQVSGGELQRIAIVRAMLARPALIFADEATSRLDLVSQQVTMDILMSEVDETGCALLLVTHDDSLARAVTHHRLHLGDVG